MSAHIFVGQDSKITDVYKAKDNSGAEFLGAFQDRVREREFPLNLLLIIVLRIEVGIPPSTYETSLYHYGNAKQNTKNKTRQRIDIKQ